MAALLGIIVTVVIAIILLKLALHLIGLVIAVALGVLVYFVAEKLVGKGR